MYLSYKRYDKCLEQKDQKIDIFHFSIEIVMSIFIYLVILPFFFIFYTIKNNEEIFTFININNYRHNK